MAGCLSQSTINVIQLGFGFFLNFFAFNSQGFIEEAVIESSSNGHNMNKHAGYYSLSIIYAVFTVSNMVAAPFVAVLTPKWSMMIGVLCYAVFQAGFLYLNEIYLYISSGIIGFGAAILWTGQGTYLSQNSTAETSSRNSALLWALAEGSLVGGGIFLFVVFRTSDTTDGIRDSTVHILYGVFTAITLLAAVTLALLKIPESVENDDREKPGSTFSLMVTKEMLLMASVFAYTGIEQSFWTGVYPTCISFTRQLGSNTNSLLALNSIATGIGQIAAGLIFGILDGRTKKLGRDSIVLLGTTVHLVAFLLIYMNFPANAPLEKTDDSGGILKPNLAIALICGGLLGFGDACWNTQIYAYLCDVHAQKSSEAFALFKFYQAGLSCAAFYYSSLLALTWHIVILVVTSIVAAICFFISERIRFTPLKKEDFNLRL
ncbi:unnamed protein product [Heligmosomoides polygyrus]|uniref:UNC93-like protein MFSD11 n=1 Tax=Heligmosomoides polygyrus TaxID=6339 RepID=A0A3P7Z043_HELPZ|nr:unnamed protein product [Heligmosomoides polygyrus]